MKQLQQVSEFHKAFNIPILQPGEQPKPGRLELRLSLIQEETKELIQALSGWDVKSIAKELADCYYVALGMKLEMGWVDEPHIYHSFAKYAPSKAVELLPEISNPIGNEDLLDYCYCILSIANHYGLMIRWEQIFDEVHCSNMSKLDENGKPVLRADGKVLKSNLYSPADLNFLNR
jgi:hypothetical protein